MPDQNLGQLTLLTAAQVEAAADRLCVWDNSATGAVRTKGMLFSQLLAWIGTNLGGKRHTRSFSEPTSKNIGDTWEELDESDRLRYGWAWSWDGARWKSIDLYISQTYENSTTGGSVFQPMSPMFDVYIKQLAAQMFSFQGHDASNNWKFAIDKRDANNTATLLGETTTINQPAQVWTFNALVINALVSRNEASTVVIALYPNAGSPGPVFTTWQVAYNLVRV